MQLESSVTLFDDNKVEDRFAELQVTADGITSEVSRKVGNDEVISRINQSAEAVTINANKVNIDGVITAINNGSSTTINGGKITTNTLNGDRIIANTINGNRIIANTLSAGAIKADSGQFNTANIPDLNADKITSGDILANRMSTNLISAFQAVVADLKALAATIGGFFIGDTDIHTKDVPITSNADNSVGLSSSTFTRTVNGTSRSNLKFAIGSKFGVDKSGTLYANGANVTSISADNISTGTINTARLNANEIKSQIVQTAELDASKITTGTLSADRIGAESIGAGKIKVDEINIGAAQITSGTIDTARIPNLSAGKITTGTISIARIPSTARNDTYITDIGDDGIRVHDSHTSKNAIVIDSDGMEVFKGGTTDEYSVAKYGDTTRIGKTSGKHIEITNTNFNVYDDDGSKPFVVSTASSSTQSTCNRWYYVKANSSLNNQLYFKGTLVDNKVSVGVAASGRPSASTYVTLTNTGTNYTVTVSGVKYTLSRTNGVLTYKIENTNSAQRSCLLQYTQSYKQTYVRENTHLLAPSSQSITIENITGTCSEIHLYTYGGIAHLWLSVYNGSSIADGGLMYQGKLGDILPVAQCYMTGFTNNAYVKKVAGRISYDGDVYVYNVSGGSLSTTSSNYATLSVTYVMKD